MKSHTAMRIVLLMISVAFLDRLPAREVTDGKLGRLVYKKNSLYHNIFVYQNGSVMTLNFGRRPPVNIQSRINNKNLRQHMLEYTKVSFCSLCYNPEPKKMLVVGLGGGVIPREMRHYFPQLDIDIVEIDPEIPIVAKKYFQFREDENLKVHIDDGRIFIKKQLRLDNVPKYDIIVLDAFNSDYIPFHLMTKEFLEQVKGVLADDGVVIANVFYSNRLFDAELKTFLAVFGRCQTFFCTDSGNAILVSPGPNAPALTVKQATERARNLQQKKDFDFNMVAVARRLITDITPETKAKILTDDKAPVNWLQTQPTQRIPRNDISNTEKTKK